VAFECASITVTVHAASRMYQRQIGFVQLRAILEHADIIEADDHPTDPKYLLLGLRRGALFICS
jgi:hypothetical protein